MEVSSEISKFIWFTVGLYFSFRVYLNISFSFLDFIILILVLLIVGFIPKNFNQDDFRYYQNHYNTMFELNLFRNGWGPGVNIFFYIFSNLFDREHLGLQLFRALPGISLAFVFLKYRCKIVFVSLIYCTVLIVYAYTITRAYYSLFFCIFAVILLSEDKYSWAKLSGFIAVLFHFSSIPFFSFLHCFLMWI